MRRRRFSRPHSFALPHIVALLLGVLAVLFVFALLAAFTPRPAGGQTPGGFELLPDLLTPRSFHEATALADGRVLITGGFEIDAPANTAAAELYLPDSATFADAGLMRLPRSGHTATLLSDGDVLLAGGSSLPFVPVAISERFDVASETFVEAGSLLGSRSLHTATLLDDGRVLIVGGLSGGAGSELASAELYDPATDTFSTTGSMAEPRAGHTATRLPDGRVLVVGGAGPTGAPAGSEIYDPSSGAFTPTVSMVVPRSDHATVGLPDGRVFIFGGRDAGFSSLAATEVFDPSTKAFHVVAPLNRARQGHSATLLLDGRILVLGGLDPPELAAAAAELYNPAVTGSLGFLDPVLVVRSFHTATFLPDGRVMIAGGVGPLAGGSAERFWPPPPPDRDVALVAGWNLVTWTGEETPLAVAIAGLPAITSVFAWDLLAQDFLAFRRGAPQALNTLLTVRTGDGLWVFAGQPAIWQMSDFGLARSVLLGAGFNLAGWTGSDGVPVAEIAEAIGPGLVALYFYDPLAVQFLSFRPGGAAFLNPATTINHGDGLWLEMSAGTAWNQPATGLQ